MGGRNAWCYVHRKAETGDGVLRLVSSYPVNQEDDSMYQVQFTKGPATGQICLHGYDFTAALELFEAVRSKIVIFKSLSL